MYTVVCAQCNRHLFHHHMCILDTSVFAAGMDRSGHWWREVDRSDLFSKDISLPNIYMHEPGRFAQPVPWDGTCEVSRWACLLQYFAWQMISLISLMRSRYCTSSTYPHIRCPRSSLHPTEHSTRLDSIPQHVYPLFWYIHYEADF